MNPRASIPVGPEVTLVVTEGNYLLFGSGPWATIRTLLDECWFLELDEAVRQGRMAATKPRAPDRSHRTSRGFDLYLS
jgi:pantothenate kinase